MTDKNGVEIRTGAIVEITGAYFKNDNGLYFVERTPGEPNWWGKDYCLKKITKKGKLSTARHNICFWPIAVFVSSPRKSAEADRWNKEHATIEVKTIEDMTGVVASFQEELEKVSQEIEWLTLYFEEDTKRIQQSKAIKAHYEAVIQSIEA